jgi:hypothetical protein
MHRFCGLIPIPKDTKFLHGHINEREVLLIDSRSYQR